MKVSEAKEKICPFMSNYEILGSIAISKEKKCICGNCMAWEYTKTKIEKDSKSLEYGKDGTLTNSEEYQLKKKGYVNNGNYETFFKLTLFKDLTEENKEGICKRLEGN